MPEGQIEGACCFPLRHLGTPAATPPPKISTAPGVYRRHRPESAKPPLGGESLALGHHGALRALCQALALTAENDFGTLYRPGFALARYLAAAGELTDVPGRSPPRGSTLLEEPGAKATGAR